MTNEQQAAHLARQTIAFLRTGPGLAALAELAGTSTEEAAQMVGLTHYDARYAPTLPEMPYHATPAHHDPLRPVQAAVAGLPGEWTETHLLLPPDLPYDEWVQVGNAIKAVGKAVQWWLGDWLLYGEHTYGQKFAQAADATGYRPQTLMNYQYTASRIPPERRRAGLEHAHHAEVASLPDAEADALLEVAESQGWTRDETRQGARQVRAGQGVPTAPPEPERCPACGQVLPPGRQAAQHE